MIDDSRVNDGGVFERPPRPNLPPTFQQLRVHTDWRTSWTHIVGGKFSAAHDDGVLFYEGSTGFAEIYETDGHGNISLLRQHADLGRSLFRSHRWTQIVVGRFSNSANSSLLLVDANERFAATSMSTPPATWSGCANFRIGERGRTSPSVRLTGRSPTYSAVLRYDQSTGRGEILTCDGTGGFAPPPGERRLAPPGPTSSAGSRVERRCFSMRLPRVIARSTTSNTTPRTRHRRQFARQSRFGGAPAGCVHRRRRQLRARFRLLPLLSGLGPPAVRLGTTHQQRLQDQEQYAGLGSDWDLIAAAGFWTPDDEDYKFREGRFSSLLFYDRDAGRGEFFLHSPLAAYEHAPLAGYTSRGSVKPGESIEFFVSSAVGPYSMRIYRLGRKRELVAEVLNHSSGAHPLAIPILGYKCGPGWAPAATVRIPDHWPSGLYVAHVTAGGIVDRRRHRGERHRASRAASRWAASARHPVRRARARAWVAVRTSSYSSTTPPTRRTTSGAAVSTAFGVSVRPSTPRPAPAAEVMPRGFRVSFRRPFIGETPFVGKKWIYWEEPLAQWLDRLEIGVEWATLVDLHEDPTLLDAYDMVVSTGHAEYFSQEMYDRLQAFIARGGNAAFFSGNNCWWRIRIEDGGDTMVCYKKEAFDPASVKTINWTEQESGALVGTTLGVTVLSPGRPTARIRATTSTARPRTSSCARRITGCSPARISRRVTSSELSATAARWSATRPISGRRNAMPRGPSSPTCVSRRRTRESPTRPKSPR